MDFVFGDNMMKVIAHRGSGVGQFENTLRGLNIALASGVDGVEFDVRRAQDGVPVVIHDATLDRTTNGTGLVEEHSLTQLKNLDAGEGEQIPTLMEVLELTMVDKTLIFHVDIKSKDIEEQVLHIGQEMGLLDRVVISSFHPSVLKRIRQLNAEVTTAYLYSSDETAVRTAQKLGCMGLHPIFTSVTPELVKEAKSKGLFVNAWTVNFTEEMQRLIGLGVDGIITDNPPLLLELLRSDGG